MTVALEITGADEDAVVAALTAVVQRHSGRGVDVDRVLPPGGA